MIDVQTVLDTEPIKLVIGDCLDIMKSMPDDSVDIVVTSPPYNQLGSRVPSVGSGIFKGSSFIPVLSQNGYADDRKEEDYQQWLFDIVKECLRVSRGLVWVNHKVRYRDKEAIHPLHFLKFPVYSEVIWDRGSSHVLNSRRFAPSHEVIYGFGLPHYWNNEVNTNFSVWRINPATDELGEDHPCPFPRSIPRRCIRASCPTGGIVLDPFAGSGTTGHAAVEEGCKSLLIEIDPRYEPIIQKRIDHVKSAGITPHVRPEQRKTKTKWDVIF